MNKILEAFARNFLKEGLGKLGPENRRVFKLMYARDKGRRSVEDAVAMDTDLVVDRMEVECLDRAMEQIQRSLDLADERRQEASISSSEPQTTEH